MLLLLLTMCHGPSLFSLVEGFLSMSIVTQGTVVVLAFIGLTAFEEWLWMLTAVTRRLTVRELRSIWTYKHCFAIQSPPDD